MVCACVVQPCDDTELRGVNFRVRKARVTSAEMGGGGGAVWSDSKTTHLVLASQVDGECEADDENSEVCIPNWSPHAQILDNPINDWSTEGLKLKLVRVKID